jgi:hypothetical protein
MPPRNGLLFIVLTHAIPVTVAGDLSGFAAAEVRFFTEEAAFPEQTDSIGSPSLVLQPEYRYTWNAGRDRLTFIPFLRLDATQSSRNHFDLREFNWLHQGTGWDLHIGLGKVFWGVAESRHLIDIINQTDLVENTDEEDKLGQPLLNLNLTKSWGNLSLFLLPGFRERPFIGPKDRLRFLLPVDEDHAVFDSSLEEWHVDVAGRWSRTFGDWDVGIAHFWGTSREPRLVASSNRDGNQVLVPHYDIINQTSLDIQAALGNWLLKLEAMTRGGHSDRFAALVAGFEYTFYQVFGSGTDLGILAEYLYDGREATAPPTPFDDDLFVGTRLTLNDPQSTELLIGAIIDRHTQATLASLEGSRRIGDKWKLEIEARAFLNIPDTDFTLKGISQDDYIQITLARYF